MIEDILMANADKGFAYFVAVWLLWKGYTQDKEFLVVLTELKNSMMAHTKQKDEVLDILTKDR